MDQSIYSATDNIENQIINTIQIIFRHYRIYHWHRKRHVEISIPGEFKKPG